MALLLGIRLGFEERLGSRARFVELVAAFAFILAIHEAFRRALARAESRSAELERRVEERTRELERIAGARMAEIESLLAHVPFAFAFFDRAYRYLLVNAALARMNGLSTNEHHGRTIHEVVPEFVPLIEPLLRKVFETGEVLAGFEVTAAGKDRPEELRDWRLHVFPVFTPGGAITSVGALIVDITERKRADRMELAVRDARARAEQSLSKLEAILGSMAEAVLVSDAEGNFVSLNPSAGETAGDGIRENGRPVSPIIGMHLRDFFGRLVLSTLDGRELPLEEWPISRAIRGEVFSDLDLRMRRPTGEVVVLRYAGRAVRDPDGKVEFGVVTMRDVTRELRAAEEREALLASERAAREEAQRASRLKDEFLATVSHELRTPLTAIAGWSQMLQKPGPAPATVARGLEVIDRNARLLTQLISDLLDVGRIVSGKLKLDVSAVDVEAVIDAALESVRHAADAKSIELTRCEGARGRTILGDPGRIQQIAWNLLSNAIKFTSRGGVVEVSCTSHDTRVEIAVKDTGQGITPEFLPHVFERFRQADASAARQHGGLGLGLAIVRHLAELHGGRVRAESEGPGKGARFVVELPVAPVRDEPLANAPFVQPGSPESTRTSFANGHDLSGARVLVVDDEPDTRDVVQRLLEEHGAEVVAAASAEEALGLVEARTIDVLVSDLGMPGMDGFALIREIRSARTLDPSRLPAVALTAFVRPEDRRRALASGYQAHIEKPIEPMELVAAVGALALRRRGASRDSSGA
ncbi:PAS domain-containing hybrid sensor histidine kinase/response regulator [Polyangium jinanense]|uniref:histidine kinase n=1 Tax=Polyangium jinanense TaxID=2829994 RepID=A0A9X3XJX7_9BACT|nr:ATP-binding protein [Polyangium jinanense]MDC3962792.1 PAS domain-containing protein [Polyangium jinanense]MDC3989531.1 PAS domain-containing protein [Polyangium jinanense]